jgi:membrane-bound lytic murein transglycosylase D
MNSLRKVLFATLLFACFQATATNFPKPESLEPAVDFWVKVYTGITTNQGYIHDAVDMSVNYETLELPEYASNRKRGSQVTNAKFQYVKALTALGKGKRSNLTDTEARALAAWPDNTSSKTFQAAAHNVRFQLGQSNRFKEGLVRSGQWKPHIRSVLAKYELPPELEVLPHVESSFNPSAYSKVAAAGMWQFMPRTAKDFMRVDHVVDERMDPFVATEGAAKLLKRNYHLTGTWPLALTSYNHGTGGVLRATKQVGTKDIGAIVQSYRGRAFGFASRNFYASFLAAMEVDQNAERYFGPLSLQAPTSYDIVVVSDYIPANALSDTTGIGIDSLREHNPALREMVWSGEKRIPRGFTIRVPTDHLSQPLGALLAAVPDTARYSYQQPDLEHRIVSGDSLSTIARRYSTSVSKLMTLNGMRNTKIRAGKTLVLPGSVAPEHTTAATTLLALEPGVYVIQRGDSLWSIARRFKVSEKQLVVWNGISPTGYIQPGQKLKVTSS